MTSLRKQAKGRECQVRLPGVCNFNPETTVLAHLRMPGITGYGIKAPDQLGAHACYACHMYVDTHSDDATKVAFYEGIFRSQAQLIKEGKIK